MYIFSFVAFSAWVLNVIVILSTNNGFKVTKSLSWAWSRCDEGCEKIFLGIWDIVVTTPGNDDRKIPFSSTMCQDNLEEEVCDDCSAANRTAICFAAICLALTSIGLFSNFMRTKSEGNTTTNMIVGIVTSLFAIFTGMISVIAYDRGCLKHIEDKVDENDWHYGPSFIILVVVILLKLVDLIGNAISPVGEVASSANAGKNAPVPQTA